MDLATRMHDIVSERGDATLEFARDGYRLSLNPIEDRFNELGFIIWREEQTGGMTPVATGRAVDDQLLLDGEPAEGEGLTSIAGMIAALLEGELVASQGSGGNEHAIPTGI